eukprot:Sspe_Gene.119579::Locus_115871_Transcript_1_1_Confidence_1.000_Length_1165::g.119579::m.119579/K05692/ACTB_G1; actin beta/gamma 1
MSDDEVPALVIDIGHFNVRAGFAGDDAPREVFPSVLGKGEKGAKVVGDEAMANRGKNSVARLLEKHQVPNWDNWEHAVHHIFYNVLRVAPEERVVLFSLSTLAEDALSERMAQVLFETFSVPAFYIADDLVLSMYASGRTSGVVLDMGHQASVCAVAYEGHTVRSTIKSTIGGMDVTRTLSILLRERGYGFEQEHEEVIADIKEKLATVLETSDEKNYELPDGQVITVGEERTRCTEELRNGVANAVAESIASAHSDLHKDSWANVILAGGCSLLDGIPDKMQLDVTRRCPPSLKPKVIAPPERKYTTWIGGSILASLSTFADIPMTNDVYDEEGPRAILLHAG